MGKRKTQDLPLLFDLSPYTKQQHPDDIDIEGLPDLPLPPAKKVSSVATGELAIGTRIQHKHRQYLVGQVTEVVQLEPGDICYQVAWQCGREQPRLYNPSELIPLDADTESSPEQSPRPDTESSLINREDCPTYPTTAYDSVSPLITRNSDTESPDTDTPTDDSVSASLKYAPRGTARGDNRYFRFSYRDNGKMKHKHIPGGNTTSPIAKARWEQVQEMKRAGHPTASILSTIESWY